MAAVGILGLAIGITTTMFTVVDALILRPVPFSEPDRLASIVMVDEDGGPALVSPAVLRAWEKSPAFTAAEGTRSDTVLIETDGGIAKRKIARVTPGVFDLLGGLTAREREFGTRAALGAPRSRLVRQAFLEGAGIGAVGLVAGIGVGSALVSLSRAYLPVAFLSDSLHAMHIDLRVLGATSVTDLVATLVAGLVPAFIGTRVNAGRSLHPAGRSGTETAGARAATRVLLVCQIALSCTLLLGATLLVCSFVNLVTADRGFDMSHILVADVERPSTSFATQQSRDAVVRSIDEQGL